MRGRAATTPPPRPLFLASYVAASSPPSLRRPPADTVGSFGGDTARPCLAWAAPACVIFFVRERLVLLRSPRAARAPEVAVPRGRSASNTCVCAPASPPFLLRELQSPLHCRTPDPPLAEVVVAGVAVGRFSVFSLGWLPRLYWCLCSAVRPPVSSLVLPEFVPIPAARSAPGRLERPPPGRRPYESIYIPSTLPP